MPREAKGFREFKRLKSNKEMSLYTILQLILLIWISQSTWLKRCILAYTPLYLSMPPIASTAKANKDELFIIPDDEVAG
jgi:hypothetical protein